MEDVFRQHKPRWRDSIDLLRLDTVKDILMIPEMFQSVGDIFEVLIRLFIKNPFLLTIVCILINLEPLIKHLNYEDSVFLHTIYSLKSLCSMQMGMRMEMDKRLCIGLIPDGNRRWAKDNNLPTHIGHFIGASRIADIIRYCCLLDTRIRHIVVYVLSYDNLMKRSAEEQSALISILEHWLEEFDLIHKSKQADICVVGEPTEELRHILSKTSLTINPICSKDSHRLKVSLLLCYDGRREIHECGGDPSRLWLNDTIDAVIRTGNTRRASGFCTYQTAYSEWFFPDLMWPDMSIPTFRNIVNDIINVEQNYGK